MSREKVSMWIVFAVVAAMGIATVLFQNHTRATAYSAGCQDIFINLYREMNVQKVNYKGLKALCDEKAEDYLRWK